MLELELAEATMMAAALLPFVSPDHPRLSLTGIELRAWEGASGMAYATDGQSAAIYSIDLVEHRRHDTPAGASIWIPRQAVRWLAAYKLPSRARRKPDDPELTQRLFIERIGTTITMKVESLDSVSTHTAFPADMRGTTFPDPVEIARLFWAETRPGGTTVDPVKLEAVGKWARQHRKKLGGRRPQAERILVTPRQGGGLRLACGPLTVALPGAGSEPMP